MTEKIATQDPPSKPATTRTNTVIAIKGIVVGDRLRTLQADKVKQLAESMGHPPWLIHPISVKPWMDDRFKLVAGAHRLEAAKFLGWEFIAAMVLDDIDADQIKLVEIDENLIRAELSPAEEAAHLAARKAIYLRLHPETERGGDRKSEKSKSQPETLIAPAFIDDTATKTGDSRASVARKTARGERIQDVGALAGTALDNGAELDALAKKSKAEQHKLMEQAKAGKQVSARSFTNSPPKNHSGNSAKAKATLDSTAWSDASPQERQRFLHRISPAEFLAAMPASWRPHLVVGLRLTKADLSKKLLDDIATSLGRFLSDAKMDSFEQTPKPGTAFIPADETTADPNKPTGRLN